MRALVAYAVLVLILMIGASAWATAQLPIQTVIAELLAKPHAGNHPWFWVTVIDAYLAFGWFAAWMLYKETAWGSRLGWLLGILLTGNLAMATYLLWQWRRLPENARAADLLLRRSAVT
jgi:hypothetical protein